MFMILLITKATFLLLLMSVFVLGGWRVCGVYVGVGGVCGACVCFCYSCLHLPLFKVHVLQMTKNFE